MNTNAQFNVFPNMPQGQPPMNNQSNLNGGPSMNNQPNFNNNQGNVVTPNFGGQAPQPPVNAQPNFGNAPQNNQIPMNQPNFNNNMTQPNFGNAPQNNQAPMSQPNFNNNTVQPNFGNAQPNFGNTGSQGQAQEYEKDEKKLYHERSKIVKFATNTTFFEVLNYNFKRGTIVINMQSYKNNKQSIKISLKFSEFLYLKHLITTGQIFQNQPDGYGNLFKFQKGTGAKYSNGNVTARQLSFQNSKNPERYPIVFFAQEGQGKQDSKGLIQFNGKPEKSINFPMTHEMLIEFFEVVTLHLNGYMSACYQYQLANNDFFTKE